MVKEKAPVVLGYLVLHYIERAISFRKACWDNVRRGSVVATTVSAATTTVTGAVCDV